MKDLIKAINAEFGEGEIKVAVFFRHNPDGTIKDMSPMFQLGDKLNDPRPGATIQEMVKQLKQSARAINYMADDMVKKTLSKN